MTSTRRVMLSLCWFVVAHASAQTIPSIEADQTDVTISTPSGDVKIVVSGSMCTATSPCSIGMMLSTQGAMIANLSAMVSSQQSSLNAINSAIPTFATEVYADELDAATREYALDLVNALANATGNESAATADIIRSHQGIQVLSANGTYMGDLIINGDNQFVTLQPLLDHISVIRGNLVITNLNALITNFGSSVFTNLTRVTGDILIVNNAALRSMGTGAFPALVSVGASLTIQNNPFFGGFNSSFPMLTTITGPLLINNNVNLNSSLGVGAAFPLLSSVFNASLGPNFNAATQIFLGDVLSVPGAIGSFDIDPLTTMLSGVRIITGSLTIQNQPATFMSFPANFASSLVVVGGGVTIQSNAGLITLANTFPNLMSCGGNGQGLNVNANGGLNTLGNAFQRLQLVQGQLVFTNHGGVVSMTNAFPSLLNVSGPGAGQAAGLGFMSIQNNANVRNMSGAFPQLKWVNGMLMINGMQGLISMDGAFPNVVYCGGLQFSNAMSVTSSSNLDNGFPALVRVGGLGMLIQSVNFISMNNAFSMLIRSDFQMQILFNNQLISFGNAFPRLVFCGGQLNLNSNANVAMFGTPFAMLQLVQGQLLVANMRIVAFTSLAGVFPQLMNVTGALIIQQNDFVTDMTGGFPNLVWVTGQLSMSNMLRLPLSGVFPRLGFAGGVNIQGSYNLASSSGVMNNAFPLLVRVGTAGVVVSNNNFMTSMSLSFRLLDRCDGIVQIQTNNNLASIDGMFTTLTMSAAVTIVSNNALTSLGNSFSNLMTATGLVTISTNPLITSLAGSFPRLSTCAGLTVNQNNNLHMWGSAFAQLQMVQGTLSITNHVNYLTSVTGAFPWLRNVTVGLTMTNNNVLTNFVGAFANLTWVNGVVSFGTMSNSMAGTFPMLGYAGGISINSVYSIGPMGNMNNAFPLLRRVGPSGVSVQNCNFLASMDGAFPLLDRSDGTVIINNNVNQNSMMGSAFPFANLVLVNGALQISTLNAVGFINMSNSFPRLRNVTTNILISGLNNLQEMSGAFPLLAWVNTQLTVQFLPFLRFIDSGFPSLEYAGGINFNNIMMNQYPINGHMNNSFPMLQRVGPSGVAISTNNVMAAMSGAFPRLSRNDGQFRIQSCPRISNLDNMFNNLTISAGTFILQSNNVLMTMTNSFIRLATVGSLTVNSNNALMSITNSFTAPSLNATSFVQISNLPVLVTITNSFTGLFQIANDFNIVNNAVLTSMTGSFNALNVVVNNMNLNNLNALSNFNNMFNNLMTVNALSIQNNILATSMTNSFTIVTAINGQLTVQNNAFQTIGTCFNRVALVNGIFFPGRLNALTSITNIFTAPSMISTGTIQMINMPMLQTISNSFTGLTRVSGDFIVQNNQVLNSMAGSFNSLNTVVATFNLNSNNGLPNFNNMFNNLMRTGTMNIVSNAAVTAMTNSFNNVTTINGQFSFQGNNLLDTFSNSFSRVVNVGGMTINNAVLRLITNVFTAPSMISTGTIQMINMPMLVTISNSFTGLTRISADLNIQNNRVLNSVSGSFTALNAVTGVLRIFSNPALTGLSNSFIGLRTGASVGSVQFYGNGGATTSSASLETFCSSARPFLCPPTRNWASAGWLFDSRACCATYCTVVPPAQQVC